MLFKLNLKEPDWGTMEAIIIRAPDEKKAREVASSEAYGEGRKAWLDQDQTICKELHIDGDEEIILKSTVD